MGWLFRSFLSFFTSLGFWRCGLVIECRDGNRRIENNEKRALKIITLLVLEESADCQDGEDEHHDVEDFEVEVQALVEAPTDNNGEWAIEKSSLESGSEDMRDGKVHLIVESLVDSCEVLGKFLHKRYQDQTHKGIGDIAIFDDKLDLMNKCDCDDGDKSDGNDEADDSFGQGKLIFGFIMFSIPISTLIILEDGIINTVVTASLKEDVKAVRDEKENRDDAGYLESSHVAFMRAE